MSKFIRYSIKDSQDSFLLFASTVAALEEIILKKKEKCGSIQPFIIILGELTKPESIFVYIDEVKYQMFSVVAALDICFKAFHVLNLEYPHESSSVWQFIQTYFYQIKHKKDKLSPAVTQIIADLENSNK